MTDGSCQIMHMNYVFPDRMNASLRRYPVNSSYRCV